MAFSREYIRKAAKESGVEIPKELEDALMQEHLNARDFYAGEQVKKALEENKQEPVKVKETQEYKDLKKAFDDYKADQTAKETRATKTNAYRELLKEIGISEKRLDTVLKVSDIDGVEIVDGKIKDADKLKESLKTEWGEFIPVTTTKGTDTANPPTNNTQPIDLGNLSMAEYIKTRKGDN